MAQRAVTQIPGADTGEVPKPPAHRAEKTAFIGVLADPLWDIDTLPLTYTNSRWSAFFYRADEKHLLRVVPECLDIEDDVVEFWHVDHNHTMLGPYGEMGVTRGLEPQGRRRETYYSGYYPYMHLTQDAAIDAGRVLGFPKNEAFIRVLEHGGAPDDGYGVYDTKVYQFDYFSFLMIRNGYVIHSATGHDDDWSCPPSRSSTATPTTAG
jgi:acetoacetate decarboxylase